MSSKVLPLTFTAIALASTAHADAPRIVADIAPVHSLVAQVMEGVGAPDLIIQSGASPHSYNLRPSEAAAMQEANVVFWIGPDLTPWLEDATETLAGDAQIVALLDLPQTQRLEFRDSALFEAHAHEGEDEHGHEAHGHDEHKHDHGHEEHGHEEHAHDSHKHDDHGHEEHSHKDHNHDHEHEHEHGHEEHSHDAQKHDDHGHEEHSHKSHDHDHDHEHGHEEHSHEAHGHEGHAHGAHDPHAWLSPTNAVAWLNVIAATLSEIDPANADTYAANADAAKAELGGVTGDIMSMLAPVKGKQFIVFHDAYQYFETAFGIPAAGAISLSDASDPSPARIEEIQTRIKGEGIDCVLAVPQFNPGIVAVVTEGTEVTTGVVDPLGSDIEIGPDFYPALLTNLANNLTACLK